MKFIDEMLVRFSLHTFVRRMGAVVVVLALPLLAPTLTDASSVSQLRHAFDETFLSLRVTRTPGACSLATAQGRISMIEMMRGQEHYLPTTTCEEAFSEAQQEFLARDEQEACGTAEAFKPFIKSTILKNAIVHVKGKRATIQLVEDLYCLPNGTFVRGAAAVRMDPMGISRWVRRRGRWLFNNAPTGTYSPTGRKSVALLRSALSGGIITESAPPPYGNSAASFCANGSSHLSWLGQFTPNGGSWYVTAGYSVATHKLESPFDAQGNPQGAVFVYEPIAAEWDIKLVGGTIVASSATYPPEPTVFQPGAAGC
jgi:hypothetical protein